MLYNTGTAGAMFDANRFPFALNACMPCALQVLSLSSQLHYLGHTRQSGSRDASPARSHDTSPGTQGGVRRRPYSAATDIRSGGRPVSSAHNTTASNQHAPPTDSHSPAHSLRAQQPIRTSSAYSKSVAQPKLRPSSASSSFAPVR